MITIIMPFYKKLQEFIFSFDHHNLAEFNRNPNLELIISVDDPNESEELISYLAKKTYAGQVRFAIKVFVNEKTHAWRCPSSAINVGIKHAQHEKILVMSPETIALESSIQKLIANCNANQYAFGIIKHTRQENIASLNGSGLDDYYNQTKLRILPYGSICFMKKQADQIGGYDESFIEWGGDDDDFRERLSKAGYQKTPTFAKFLHVLFTDRGNNRSSQKEALSSETAVLSKLTQIVFKEHYVANQGRYGNAFDHVSFAYQPALQESPVVSEL